MCVPILLIYIGLMVSHLLIVLELGFASGSN